MPMVIKDTRQDKHKAISLVSFGDVLEYRGQIYIKTDEMDGAVIDMAGRRTCLLGDPLVTVLHAELVIHSKESVS